MTKAKLISVIYTELHWSRWQILEEGQWPKNVFKVSQLDYKSKPVYFLYIWHGSQNSSFFMRIWIEALDFKRISLKKNSKIVKTRSFEMAFFTNILGNLILQFVPKVTEVMIRIIKNFENPTFKWNLFIW